MVLLTGFIYFEDCYVREFDAVIVESFDDRVILDRSAFYPEGGGQPSDTGSMDGVRVVKAEKSGGDIVHVLDENNFEEGETVHCELDWDKRYAHMKYHTAQHVLSAIVLDEVRGRTTGNQVYEDRARIDFDTSISDKTEMVEKKVNDVIKDEREVDIYTMSRDEAVKKLDKERTRIDLLPDSIQELRIVEIENLDKTACAGTHVKNTKELGEFQIKNTINKGEERKRVEFELTGT